MSILGILIDKQSHTREGDALRGAAYVTLAHSLPATNPEVVIPVMRSIEIVGNGTRGTPKILGLGGNASTLTIGYMNSSNASCLTIAYDILAIVFHSSIR